ncbi:MAG: type secretion system protein [Caulobacteraceae bacterium]|nr:type secretion system protein [Caulobacteraceae bacterium]
MMLSLLIGLLAFITIAGLGWAATTGEASGTKAVKRVMAGQAAQTNRNRAKSGANVQDSRRKQIVKALREEDKKHRKATVSLGARLQQTGLNLNVRTFWIVSGVLGVVGFIVPLVVLRQPLIGLGAAVAAGLGLPRWVVNFLGKRRTTKFTLAFSDALDIIVRGIKSGIPVHDCLKIISQECPEPVAGEFKRVMENLGVGMGLDQALDKMFERMPVQEVKFFAIVLAIQAKTGGNLAEALGNLSSVIRARKMLREKIKALSSEAIASAFIIGFLPIGVAVLLSVTNPTYMKPLFFTGTGHLLLGIAAVLMVVGIVSMRKMINFKF